MARRLTETDLNKRLLLTTREFDSNLGEGSPIEFTPTRVKIQWMGGGVTWNERDHWWVQEVLLDTGSKPGHPTDEEISILCNSVGTAIDTQVRIGRVRAFLARFSRPQAVRAVTADDFREAMEELYGSYKWADQNVVDFVALLNTRLSAKLGVAAGKRWRKWTLDSLDSLMSDVVDPDPEGDSILPRVVAALNAAGILDTRPEPTGETGGRRGKA